MDDTKGWPRKHEELTYTTLISVLSQSGLLEVAIALYHNMLRKGLLPTMVTFNILITELYGAKKVDRACRIFRLIEAHGYKPNSITYNPWIMLGWEY
ncbi:hypothetical protein RND71_018415 [Anisodus tanguticus]|uniref:Pentatricopeptide repeat-containing protein n=1 Tax=Anisodus tanguticus TaxID=243964 RepID=A0AAE1VJB8_9SOLA|nr:hypothetical protein RND71_018415 [Anisodus tanguticus]